MQPWRIETTNACGTHTHWRALRLGDADAWIPLAEGWAGTPQEAFAKGCDALQACPEVVGGG